MNLFVIGLIPFLVCYISAKSIVRKAEKKDEISDRKAEFVVYLALASTVFGGITLAGFVGFFTESILLKILGGLVGFIFPYITSSRKEKKRRKNIK